MSTYRVKFGYTFGGVVLLPAGSLVEMGEAEAAGFLDKLELVEGGEPARNSEPATVAPPGRLVVSVPDEAPAVSKAAVKQAVKDAEASSKGEV